MNDLALMDNKKSNQFVKGFELILVFDLFLQKCKLCVENVTKISNMVKTFVNTCMKTFKCGRNGACLIKNHLFFHLQKCLDCQLAGIWLHVRAITDLTQELLL